MNDDPAAEPTAPGLSGALPGEQVCSQLLEALVHVLVEKGVLTKNDALSIVQTVAQVKLGEAVEGAESNTTRRLDLVMLERLYTSFEALSDHHGRFSADVTNVHRLRPPLHEDRPEFPTDEL